MTLIYFILILGAVVFVHELGHFLFARLAKVHVYEFAIGMGKKIFSYKKKGGVTEYSIRMIPLGGFCQIAGENGDFEEEEIPSDRKMCNKSFIQRFMILFFGAGFNFIFAFILLFLIGLCYGSISSDPIIGGVSEQYPAYEAGLSEGDKILALNGVKVSTWDDVLWELDLNKDKSVIFKVEKENGQVKEIAVTPQKVEQDDVTDYVYGISRSTTKERGFIVSLKYAVTKTQSLFKMMFNTVKSLFTGGVSVNDLSGPVGIYNIVGTQAKAGLESIIYLVAFLSINVGFINLIPLPAFDGGRILFLIIEKIIGKPINPKVEGMIHTIGFFLLIILMIYVTFNDILRLF